MDLLLTRWARPVEYIVFKRQMEPWFGKGIWIANPDQAPVLTDLIQVHRLNDQPGNPSGLWPAHLASSRSAFW